MMALTGNTVLGDPVVQAALSQAWTDAKPGVTGGQETGGFIVQEAQGNLRAIRWPDDTAISIALAVAAANSKAAEMGYELDKMTIRVTQENVENTGMWRIYYRLIDYINTRGGDVNIWVSAEDSNIVRVLRGQ